MEPKFVISMKKCNLFFSIYLVFCVCSFSTAQVEFGIRTGLNLSTFENNTFLLQVSTEPLIKNKITLFPDVGLFINLPLTHQISIQPEMHYLTKGGKINEEIFISGNGGQGNLQSLETKYQVQFIEIPVVFKYQFMDSGWRPSLMLGASYGRAISQKFDGETIYIIEKNNSLALSGEANKLDWKTELGSNGSFNQNDWSGVVGASLAKTLGKQSVILDIRYLYDFNDWRTEKLNDKAIAQVRNRNLLLTVGVGF
jgi:hypothetical protein